MIQKRIKWEKKEIIHEIKKSGAKIYKRIREGKEYEKEKQLYLVDKNSKSKD